MIPVCSVVTGQYYSHFNRFFIFFYYLIGLEVASMSRSLETFCVFWSKKS
jgi:hypothetical protein